MEAGPMTPFEVSWDEAKLEAVRERVRAFGDYAPGALARVLAALRAQRL